mgnify:FL=1
MDKNVILAKKYGRAIYEIAAEQHLSLIHI